MSLAISHPVQLLSARSAQIKAELVNGRSDLTAMREDLPPAVDPNQPPVDLKSGLSHNRTKHEHGFSSMAEHVHEPHIVCPKCAHEIPLTESIAAPLLEA